MISITSPTGQYVYMTALASVLVLTSVLDAAYIRPGPLSIQQKVSATIVLLLATWTQTWLRAEHKYYRKMIQHGCALLPRFPNDRFGVRYLRELAQAAKTNSVLQHRAKSLHKIGHTYAHRLFPDLGEWICTDDPGIIKAILSTKFDDWGIANNRIRGWYAVLGYHSIFSVNGPEWQHARAMLRPAFVRNSISDMESFNIHILKLIARLPTDGSKVDLQALFAMLTVDSTTDFMFGQSTDILGAAPEDAVKFVKYFDASMAKVAYRIRLGWLSQRLPDRELNECSTYIRSFVEKYIVETRRRLAEAPEPESKSRYVFLNELLKSGEPQEVIRDQILSIYVAGRDTTTSVLTYLFMELSRRPDIVKAIQQEIRDLGTSNPTWEQLKNMKYLNWTLKESLRLNPPVASNSREALRDTVLPTGGGADGNSPVYVKKGTNVRYQPWCLHRRQDIYGPDAEEFRPERWEGLKLTYEYVPFNAGPRICRCPWCSRSFLKIGGAGDLRPPITPMTDVETVGIGQQYALTQMAMVTFKLLQAFNTIKRMDESPPSQKLGVNLSMVNGCWVSMVPL